MTTLMPALLRPVLLAVVVLALGAPSALADPTPFATATSDCSSSTVTFPVQSADHPDVIYSVSASGTSGNATGTSYNLGYRTWFQAGDKVWGDYGSIAAGTVPQMTVGCTTGGTVNVALADRPRAPATFSGTLSSSSELYSGFLPFSAIGAGQYVADVTLNQGALNLDGSTVASSGEVSLGALAGGDQDPYISSVSGPAASYSITVRELPVQISGLTFGNWYKPAPAYAAPGTILTDSFAVTGDTTISAYIRNLGGQFVRNLGSFPVRQGSSSITWDTSGAGGATLPDGTYYLHLDSTDPNGNISSAEIPIIVDGTPPVVQMTSPGQIKPSRAISFSVTDAESGVASISLTVDGQDVGGYAFNSLPANGQFSYYAGSPWSIGTHTWQIQTADNVANQTTVSGTFDVPGPPPPPQLTSATELSAFLHWIASRYPNPNGYWVCPKAQIAAGQGLCLGEIKVGRYLHALQASPTIQAGQIVLKYKHDTAWVRHWTRFTRRVIAGFHTPGAASVNSPTYDWAWLAAGAYYKWQLHRSSFSVIDYDGDSRGFGHLVTFRCHTHGRTIACSNALGDSMRYRPRG